MAQKYQATHIHRRAKNGSIFMVPGEPTRHLEEMENQVRRTGMFKATCFGKKNKQRKTCTESKSSMD
jgi:hypothetical protein